MIGALLLAGGEGRRMGGVDKGMQPLCGQPLYQHVLQALQPQVAWLAISANRHLGDYAVHGHPVWPDAAPWQGMGPLAALATAAANLPPHVTLLQTAPCDSPLLPADLVPRLAAALGDADVAMPVTAQGPQPACLLLRVAALAGLPAYLAAGGRSIRGWLAGLQVVEVVFDEAGFANANDAAALARLAAVMGGAG
ncbi:molybdenum cofactor guanylyltransferase MobA [Vogesella mureinivorans]|uniref:molybdenum cofactor guanylyltransferase MobA n=1 Tax=Vogesella mureinivorans TaxID=657276 RepID=UPI0011CA27F1|nr:molybdenum cofactor guanylyltransferase MobA [Vogesella mureinivorans]